MMLLNQFDRKGITAMQQAHDTRPLTKETVRFRPLSSSRTAETTSAVRRSNQTSDVDIQESAASVTERERFEAHETNSYAFQLMKKLSGVKSR